MKTDGQFALETGLTLGSYAFKVGSDIDSFVGSGIRNVVIGVCAFTGAMVAIAGVFLSLLCLRQTATEESKTKVNPVGDDLEEQSKIN